MNAQALRDILIPLQTAAIVASRGALVGTAHAVIAGRELTLSYKSSSGRFTYTLDGVKLKAEALFAAFE
jgi:hypothetical protein